MFSKGFSRSWKSVGLVFGTSAALLVVPAASGTASAGVLPGSLGSLLSGLPVSLPTGGVPGTSNLPAVGSVLNTVTSTAGSLPGSATGAAGTSGVPSLPALPVDPTGTVTSIVGTVPGALPTSGLPGLGSLPSLPTDPSSIPVVGSLISSLLSGGLRLGLEPAQRAFIPVMGT